MNNTIILQKGTAKLTNQEFKTFVAGHTIWGEGAAPEEIKRWNIDQEQEAKEELTKYRCDYYHGGVVDITEYAIAYCECDKDGEFLSGTDYDLAQPLAEDNAEVVNGYTVLSNYGLDHAIYNGYHTCSVESEDRDFVDDEYNGTLTECIEYCKAQGYTDNNARIALLQLDASGCWINCVQFYDMDGQEI